jgi:hypothetical protein
MSLHHGINEFIRLPIARKKQMHVPVCQARRVGLLKIGVAKSRIPAQIAVPKWDIQVIHQILARAARRIRLMFPGQPAQRGQKAFVSAIVVLRVL